MLDRIRIVLVNTSHPGNIGAAARAIKTMGLSQLYLVAPESFPNRLADEMAASAKDILEQAVVTQTLEEAIADCCLVVGASARTRKIPWPMQTPRAIAEKIKLEAKEAKIAVIFGREQSGLTNEELERCHQHMQIPANPDYSSLNLAAAVQVMAYELRMASIDETILSQDWDYRLATMEEMEKLFAHLREVLIEIDFLKKEAPRKLMTRLRRLLARARPDVMELNMLRGILTAIQQTKGRT